MSEPALRLLDKGLPRIQVFSQEFLDRTRKPKGRDEIRQESAAAGATITAEAKTRMDIAVKAERLVLDARAEAAAIVAAAESEAARILAEAGLSPSGGRRAVQSIIREVAQRRGVSVRDILGPSRSASIVAIRHEAIAQAYMERPDMSLPELGRRFNRDHTTVIHAVRKYGVLRGDAATAKAA